MILVRGVDADVQPIPKHLPMKKVRFYRKKSRKRLQIQKIVVPLQPQSRNKRCKRINERLVPWMSGLVSGLQNRVRRFESARNLFLMKEGSLGEWLKPPVC